MLCVFCYCYYWLLWLLLLLSSMCLLCWMQCTRVFSVRTPLCLHAAARSLTPPGHILGHHLRLGNNKKGQAPCVPPDASTVMTSLIQFLTCVCVLDNRVRVSKHMGQGHQGIPTRAKTNLGLILGHLLGHPLQLGHNRKRAGTLLAHPMF